MVQAARTKGAKNEVGVAVETLFDLRPVFDASIEKGDGVLGVSGFTVKVGLQLDAGLKVVINGKMANGVKWEHDFAAKMPETPPTPVYCIPPELVPFPMW
jgi:hypothetical protein